MLDKIIHFSINNKLLIGIFTLLIFVFGIYSFTQLPIDAVPDITNNQVQVITLSPTLSSEEVEKFITSTVELNLANTPGIEEIRSISRFGLSVVTVVFKEEIDIYWARQQINERISQISSQIPTELGMPELAPVSTGLGEIYQYILQSKKGYEDKYSLTDLRTLQDWNIRRRLLGIEGVADVSSFGGYKKQFEVAMDPNRMRAMEVSLTDVISAIKKSNQNTGGAYIEKQSQAYFIRGLGLLTNFEDIKNVFIKNTNGNTPIYVKDIAEVQLGSAMRYGAITHNGKGETVGGIVLMLKGENSSKVIDRVRAKIEEIKNNLPEGVEIVPYLDRSKMVGNTISTVSTNLIEGALIVIFVLVLFLGNMRAGLIVASMIPLSLLFAISIMYLTGASGNLMSLGAIDFGLIVDGAVIIVEAAIHSLGLRKNQTLTQIEMDDAIFKSASKIRKSASFGEIIILVVYLPILTLTGVEGKMFKPMAETIIYAIAGAFILSLTYVPMANALFLNKVISHKVTISDRIIDFAKYLYKPILFKALRFKALIIGSTLIAFVFSLIIFTRLGGEFIPILDEGDFAVETRVLLGSSISFSVETATKVEKILKEKFPEVLRVVSRIGTSEIPTDPMPMEAMDVIINLKPRSEWVSAKSKLELERKMTESLSALPGVSFSFQQPVQMRFNELMSGSKQDVGMKIFGEDLDKLTQISLQAKSLINGIEGIEDIFVEQNSGLPQIKININRENLARYNFTVEDVSLAVRTAYAGEIAGLIYEGDKRFELAIRLKEEFRTDLDNISNLYITNSEGLQIPINQLASIDITTGRNQIQREEAKRKILVGFNVRGRDIESAVNEVQEKLNKELKLPTGYFIKYGGDFENLQKAKARLSLAVPAALLLIFSLLYMTLRSVKQSFLILSAIPLASIGGILSLALRDMPFSISAGVGFIALFGIAVLNGIVLISEFNSLRKGGLKNLHNVIIRGTFIRLRPVLMTALVASLGFLPMAISNGAGAEVQKPLATVVIGGLITSTLLTLLVLPILYYFVESNKNSKRKNHLGIAILFLLFLPALSLKSENLTAEKCIEIAIKNNKQLKAIDLEIEKQTAITKTAFDFGKSSLSYQFGKFNDMYDDNAIKFSQTIPFISKMYAKENYLQSNVEIIQAQKLQLINEIKFNIRQQLNNLEYYTSLNSLFAKQAETFSKIAEAAKKRLDAGETNSLDFSFAKVQQEEMEIRIIANSSDLEIAKEKLNLLLNEKLADNTEVGTISQIKLAETKLTNRNLDANLNLKLNQAEAKSKSLFFDNEKKEYLPDLNLSLINQTFSGFTGNQRYNSFEVGISMPLIFNAQSARNQVAELDLKSLEMKNDYQKLFIQNKLDILLRDYQKFNKIVDKSQNALLLYAEDLENKSKTAYLNGELSYSDFQLAINKTFGYKETNIQNIYKLNQTALEIMQLLNEN